MAKKNEEIVSLREFAKRVGVSLPAIQKGIKSGRIAAIVDPETGKNLGIDAVSQVSAWSENSKAPQRKPNNIAGGRPRKDGQPVAAPVTNGGKLEPQAHGGALKRNEPSAEKQSMAEIQRQREIVKLQLDLMKMKQEQGELVPAADVEQAWAKMFRAAQTRILGIPAACKTKCSDLPTSVLVLIDEICRKALEDLANGDGSDD